LWTRKKTDFFELARGLYLALFTDMKQRKSYYKVTTAEEVEKYLATRTHDFEMGLLAKSNYNTEITFKALGNIS
jgi:hypothetical protein